MGKVRSVECFFSPTTGDMLVKDQINRLWRVWQKGAYRYKLRLRIRSKGWMWPPPGTRVPSPDWIGVYSGKFFDIIQRNAWRFVSPQQREDQIMGITTTVKEWNSIIGWCKRQRAKHLPKSKRRKRPK